jgi:outer membrane protein assembly factor BamA
LPWPFEIQDAGPTLRFEPRFTKKGWLEKRLVWTLAPAIELGVEEGYQFYTPSTHVGLSRLFCQVFLAEVSHHLKVFDFFNVSRTLDVNKTQLGLDYRDPYLLSYIELNTALYFTDRMLEPQDGVVIANRYQVAGGPLGGHYDFHKLTPSLSAYWQVIDRIQLAFRAEVGFIFPYGKAAAAPFNMQYYLGGADTVRGWGQRRLSPRTLECPNGDRHKCRAIPIGGKTEILSNFELRVYTFRQFFVAAFLDVGDVQTGEAVFRPKEWNYTAGGGLRYQSPIGKLRLDVGARLNSTPLSEGEDRWAFHLGLGEAF